MNERRRRWLLALAGALCLVDWVLRYRQDHRIPLVSIGLAVFCFTLALARGRKP